MDSGTDERTRCWWATTSGADPLFLAYHDDEWGVASRDPVHLFEMLTMEGAQAGLSWATILRKRAGYRAAFAGFDAEVVAGYGPPDVERLMADAGIVRNRAKIESTIGNARALVALRAAGTDPVEYLWSFVGGRPIRNRWPSLGGLPAETPASAAMSKDLKRRGFRFVGPTVCYSFMQATGMVNDHLVDCFRWPELDAAAARLEAASEERSR
ncbi:MAG TPA: DNA-3-methyladenine glycosylase I [Candidatus Eisenbacteria bacterium]|nr:DNA-3-methyladenine glycosylase I [Candidatus Eisenbacteria bacterium]